MTKYRKRPVVIDAVQWVGSPREMPMPPAPHALLRQSAFSHRWRLKTLEGWYMLTPGDWIIRGVKGEYYPCKPDIFDATYDTVGDEV